MDFLFIDWWWKMNYGKNVFIKVIDTLLSAKPPNYETVLEMDRLIRQAELPKIKLYLKPEEDDYTDPGACMRSYLMSQIRSICKCLFYPHSHPLSILVKLPSVFIIF